MTTSLKPALRQYTQETKAANDALREAYTTAIRAAIENNEFDESDRLAQELADLRLAGETVSYKVSGHNAYLKHANFEMLADYPHKEVDKFHTVFYEVAGLSMPEGLSIRAYNWPMCYVDHFGYRVHVTAYREDASWKEHSTWHKVAGLANKDRGVSFRSVSHPNRYIRVRRNGQVWLDVYENNPKFRSQATFFKKDGLFMVR